MILNRVRSVKYFTNILVLSTLAPLILIILWLLVDRYRLAEQNVYRDVLISATNIARMLDQDLVRIESGLEVLADSNELRRQDLSNFYESVKRAAQLQNVKNYIVTDYAGRQVINTFVKFGDQLPSTGTPVEIKKIFTEKKTAVSNLFIGPVTKEYVLSMGVPVKENGEIIYSLNTGISPARISSIFNSLPKEWTGAVIDGNGTIIARSKDIEKFVGKPAVNALWSAIRDKNQGTLETVTKDDILVLTGFTRSSVSDWSIAVGAPKAFIVSRAYSEALLLSLGCLFVALISFFFSKKISKKIESAIYGLIKPAQSLIEGGKVSIEEAGIMEINFVNNAMLKAFDSLKEKTYLANHDPLTGLPNRALFHEILENYLLLAKRKKEKFSLLSLDLDGFKSINDNEGHPAGDFVLKEVAARIKSSIRESDTVARFGGDEFLVLLPNSDFEISLVIAHNLIEKISQSYPSILGRLSASVGISAYPQSGETVFDLIKSSDKALYAAKSSGKGCVRPNMINA